MRPYRGIIALAPLLVLIGCASSGGSSSAKPAAATTAAGADQSESPTSTGGEIRIIGAPTVALSAAGDGSTGSLLKLRQYIANSTDDTMSYEIFANGISRGVFALGPHQGLTTEHAWTVAAGRVEIETLLDPQNLIGGEDESDNDSLIIVDVPVAATPAAQVGADIAFAYPAYITFTPEQDQNREAGYGDWVYLVMVPIGNNGSTPLNVLRVATSGHHTSTSEGSGHYVPGTVKTIGVGRGAYALERLRIGLTLDPTNEVVEVDEGNNAAAIDVVAPPVGGPRSSG